MSTWSGRALPLNSELPSWDQLTDVGLRYSVSPLSFSYYFFLRQPDSQTSTKLYNSCASHQSNEQSSAPRHEGVLWKENDLIHFPRLARRYLLICRIDTAGRRWQNGERKRRALSSKNYTPFSAAKHQHGTTGQRNGSGPSVDAETSAWPHSGPVCMQRSPQHNPSQLSPVTGRPLIAPVHRAKNTWTSAVIKSRWVFDFESSAFFLLNRCNQNKQRCEADFKSVPLMSPFPCFPSSNLTWSE